MVWLIVSSVGLKSINARLTILDDELILYGRKVIIIISCQKDTIQRVCERPLLSGRLFFYSYIRHFKNSDNATWLKITGTFFFFFLRMRLIRARFFLHTLWNITFVDILSKRVLATRIYFKRHKFKHTQFIYVASDMSIVWQARRFFLSINQRNW